MPRKDLRGKRKRTRITSEILEKMVDLRKRGFIYKEIAEKLGISPQTVAQRMQKEGLGGWRRKVTGEVLERMRGLRKEGLTYAEIAGKTGLSLPTVANYMGELRGAGLLERRVKKLRKWEPTPRRKVQNEVSIDEKGVEIFAWAARHFRGHKGVDLYIEDRMRLLGIKPVAKGQRSLTPKVGANEFHVSCTPLMREASVNERRRVPAEWSEKGKMLLVDLRGHRGA